MVAFFFSLKLKPFGTLCLSFINKIMYIVDNTCLIYSA